MNVHMHKQPLSICYAYPHVPIKPAQRSSFQTAQYTCTDGIQTNLWFHWLRPNTEDEQVLGAVQMALSTDTYQAKLIPVCRLPCTQTSCYSMN